MQTQCRGSFMRIEICIAKEKMTKMPNGAVDALKEELTRRISKLYDDVDVIVKSASSGKPRTTGLFGKSSLRGVNLLPIFYCMIIAATAQSVTTPPSHTNSMKHIAPAV